MPYFKYIRLVKIFVVAEHQCTKPDMLVDVAEVNGNVSFCSCKSKA